MSILILFIFLSFNSIYLSDNELVKEIESKNDFELINSQSLFKNEKLIQKDNNIELLFSSYMGGLRGDAINYIFVDSEENIIISGQTSSSDFPTKNGINSSYGGYGGGFLAKIDSKGNLVFSTYFGRRDVDKIVSVYVDDVGNIYLSGYTSWPDFPTKNAFDATNGNNSRDGFVAKFDTFGNLVFSTYLGGSKTDQINSMFIDLEGNIFLSGLTSSSDFPIKKAFDDSLGGKIDGFLTKFDTFGNLVFSTYIGGRLTDKILGSQFNLYSQYIYLSGVTNSSDFPIKNGFDSTFGGGEDNDIFIAKFDFDGNLIYSTYVGGFSEDYPYNFYVDSLGRIYISGYTSSPDFPTKNAFDDSLGGKIDGFLTKFDTFGNLVFSTYIGGSLEDKNLRLQVDTLGNSYLSGRTYSGDFPTKNAFDDTYSPINPYSREIFLSKFDPKGELVFSTYIGGSGNEDLANMVINERGNIYLSGYTSSPDFPTKNAFDDTFGRFRKQGFLMSFDTTGNLIFSTYTSNPNNPSQIFVDFTGMIYLAGSTFSTDFPLLNAFDNTYGGYPFDGYLIKLYPNGSTLFGTYIGGSRADEINLMYSDQKGNIYLIGTTYSPDFPTKNAFDDNTTQRNYSDAFIVKLHYFPDRDGDGMDDDWELLYGLSITTDDSLDDLDNDSIPNIAEYQFNLNPSNPSDAGWDNDSDGLSNYLEYTIKTSPFDFDTDRDGMDDGYEYYMGFSPRNPFDAGLDNDSDGLSNYLEYLIGTSPFNLDTDEDGIDDWYEFNKGLNPLIRDSHLDFDFDLVSNLDEYKAGTDPFNIFSFPLASINTLYILISFILLLSGIIVPLSIFLIKYKRLVQAPTYFETIKVWRTNFTSYNTYKFAKSKGASSVEEYELILKLNAPNMLIVKEIEGGNFSNYKQYLEAKTLGASTIEEYKLILKYKAPNYEIVPAIEQGGFPSYHKYEQARSEGYITYEEFLDKKPQK